MCIVDSQDHIRNWAESGRLLRAGHYSTYIKMQLAGRIAFKIELQFNLGKPKAILMSTRSFFNAIDTLKIRLSCDGIDIPIVSRVQNIGVIIDSKLNATEIAKKSKTSSQKSNKSNTTSISSFYSASSFPIGLTSTVQLSASLKSPIIPITLFSSDVDSVFQSPISLLIMAQLPKG